jgi:thioredoxin reductase (NADPH)
MAGICSRLTIKKIARLANFPTGFYDIRGGHAMMLREETESATGTSLLDLAIVGGGPAGLAAAIAAEKAGLQYRLIEKEALVNSIFHFPGNMTFFTSSELLEIGDLPFTTPNQKPTRTEVLRYYRRVADFYRLRIACDEEVLHIQRFTEEPAQSVFKIETRLKQGGSRMHKSRAVVLATGYYDQPNLLGVPGESLPHVTHYFHEAHPYFRKRVVIVGGNNSAAEAALELFRSGAQVTLIHHADKLGAAIKYWIRPDLENRIKEGSIAARFQTRLVAIGRESVQVQEHGDAHEIPADAVFLMTGYHPNAEFLRKAGVHVDDQTLLPEHDPTTLETNIRGLYVAGAIVAGNETNRVFIENGRHHGDCIIKHWIGRNAP